MTKTDIFSVYALQNCKKEQYVIDICKSKYQAKDDIKFPEKPTPISFLLVKSYS